MHVIRHIPVTAMLCKFVHAARAYSNHSSCLSENEFMVCQGTLVFNKIHVLTTLPEKFVSIWMRHTAVRDVKN